MDNTLFQYLIDNQSKWRELYKLQQRAEHQEYIKKVREKHWTGNSKEYKKEWDLNNKRHKHFNDC